MANSANIQHLLAQLSQNFAPQSLPSPVTEHQVACRICSENFTDINSLREHETTKHANIPVYTCKVCNYRVFHLKMKVPMLT